MVKRKLPSTAQRNPQLTPEHTPQRMSISHHSSLSCHSTTETNLLLCITDEILVERRRLGQTDLKAPGSSPGDASKTIGIFDYAHLRVPLPSDLSKSGIFTPLKNGAYPESYFLMVNNTKHACAHQVLTMTIREEVKTVILVQLVFTKPLTHIPLLPKSNLSDPIINHSNQERVRKWLVIFGYLHGTVSNTSLQR